MKPRQFIAIAVSGLLIGAGVGAGLKYLDRVNEQEIFPDPKVKAALSNFVLLQADITRMDDDDKALTEHLNMPAPPALYFWNSKGEERRDLRLIGNLTAEQLVKRISQVN